MSVTERKLMVILQTLCSNVTSGRKKKAKVQYWFVQVTEPFSKNCVVEA